MKNGLHEWIIHPARSIIKPHLLLIIPLIATWYSFSLCRQCHPDLLAIPACTCNESFVPERSRDRDERLRATIRDKSRSYAEPRRFITGCRYVNERQLSSKLRSSFYCLLPFFPQLCFRGFNINNPSLKNFW